MPRRATTLDETEKPSKTDETVIEEARERFEQSQEGSDYNRESFSEDVEFARLGNQWPDAVKKQRQAEQRPCLTINKLPSFVRQVVNDARQNKPAIQVNPVDNGADKNTAEVINGLIRTIERNSNADVAYDTAIDNAVSGGFGFFRIGIRYANDQSFDLEAYIERIANPLMVHWDTSSMSFDAGDWNYAFVSEFLDKKEFEKKYPDAEPVDFKGDEPGQLNWLDDEQIRVSEYWSREGVKRKILLLSDGRVIREETLTDEIKLLNLVTGVSVKSEREISGHEVKRRIITGREVLEDDVWPGESIPVCPVWGEEVISPTEGRRYFRSMIRDAKDPQSMFNFWRSATTELVALAPRAPWVGPKNFIPKGHEAKWASANTRSHSHLEYEGNVAPQRQPFAGVPAGALQEALNASDDMKAIIGIYDSSLGARSNETSGRAILARQKEADVSNFHFVDNLSRAIQYAGKVLVEIIPSVYSPRSTIRILGADSKEKVAKLMMDGAGQATPNAMEEADRMYDLTVGKYDVTVKAGPSYASQREETRETLVEIMRQVPGSAQYIGDILLEHMDFQGADKVTERLKMLLPPQIQQAEGVQPQGMPQQFTQGSPQDAGIPQQPQQGVPVQGIPQNGV